MNARLFRYASVGAMLALSLGSALPIVAATPKPVSPSGPAPTSGPSKLPPSPGAPAVVGTVIYDSLPSPQPFNVPSIGFAATSTSELGDHISFAGSARIVTKVTALMSAWARHSTYPAMDPTGWMHPVSLNLYNVVPGSPPTKGTLIATVTQSFKIPWKPVADPTCPVSGGNGNGWRAGDGNCYNGLAFPIVFDLTSLNVTLPDQILFGIAYNTTNYGAAPIGGAGGPYDALNFGLAEAAPSIGTDVSLDDAFLSSTWAGFYTDGGAGGLGIFRQDTGWSTPLYVPAVRFEAVSAAGLVINPSTTYVASGSTFGVDLAITDANDMAGYQFTLNYPTAMATGAGTGSYIDTDFSTVSPDGVRGASGLCWATGGTCEFAAARLGAVPGFNGLGNLAHVGFTANTPGVYTLFYTGTILSDADLHSLPVTLNTAVVNVYGTGTINGVVKLQGRATPGTPGTITMVDVAGLLPPVTTGTFDAAGNYSIPVPALVAGTTWRITADHTLYLRNQTAGATDVTVASGNTAYASTTTLKGGDANNDERVGIPDLTCIGASFGSAVSTCVGGSSDINADGITNIFDLVITGANYGLPGPLPGDSGPMPW